MSDLSPAPTLEGPNWLMDELVRAAEEFHTIPCYLRPVVTGPNAFVSAKRGCPERNCPICGGSRA